MIKKLLIILLVVLSLLIVTAFFFRGHEQERILIAKYFMAMQLNDRDMQGALAVEPRIFEFKSYKIVSISGSVVTELKLPALLKEMEEIERMKKKRMMAASVRKDVVEDAATVKDILGRMQEIKQNIENEKKLIRFSTGIDRDLEMCTGKTYAVRLVVEVETTGRKFKNYLFLLRKNIIELHGQEHFGRLIIIRIAAIE